MNLMDIILPNDMEQETKFEQEEGATQPGRKNIFHVLISIFSFVFFFEE